MPAGYLGVDLFFGLSGFLITVLLLQEHRTHGRIDFRAFYARRALRLLPPLVAFLLAYLAFTLLFLSPEAAEGRLLTAFAALFYWANWLLALGQGETYGMMGDLVHTWSLSVEEQFYLVWPPVVAILLARRIGAGGLAAVAVGGIAAAWLWRLFLSIDGAHPLRLYAGTDTRADAILAGCAAGLIFLSASPLRRNVASEVVGWLLFAGLFACALLFPSDSSTFMHRIGFGTVALLSGATLLHLVECPNGTLNRLLAVKPLVVVGRVSYATYLWHYPVAGIATPDVLGISGVPLAVARVAATAIAVTLSWYLIEVPARRIKSRFATHGVAAAGA